jgi:DNA repair photolyase
MRKLVDAGVPVRVMFSPIIPFVNDAELEQVLASGADAGASTASYTLLRLPHEVKELFRDWLAAHLPDRAERVMAAVRESHGGQDYKADFGDRMRGTGIFADMIRQRFRLAARRHGLDRRMPPLRLDRFQPPKRLAKEVPQLDLF